MEIRLMLLGVHCSIKGGLHNAFHEAESLGIDTVSKIKGNGRRKLLTQRKSQGS